MPDYNDYGGDITTQPERFSEWDDLNFICENCLEPQKRDVSDDKDQTLCNECLTAFNEDSEKDEYLEAFFRVLEGVRVTSEEVVK